MNDHTSGAAAYKADSPENATADRRDFESPFHLRLAKDRRLEFGYTEAALAAGALGLGYLAYRGVSAYLARPSDTTARRLDRTPLAESASPAKDNAAPRFAGEGISTAPATPFMAASDQDDTGDLVVEVTEGELVATGASGDRSAQTPEHVPTDLMGDSQPGPDDRAIDAFRPDATAPVPDAMRESLRPATGPAPSLAANRGDFASGLAQTDGSK